MNTFKLLKQKPTKVIATSSAEINIKPEHKNKNYYRKQESKTNSST